MVKAGDTIYRALYNSQRDYKTIGYYATLDDAKQAISKEYPRAIEWHDTKDSSSVKGTNYVIFPIVIGSVDD